MALGSNETLTGAKVMRDNFQSSFAGDALAAGEMVPSRDRITSSAITLASGVMSLTYFTATRSETVTTATLYSGSTAAAATPTLIRVGVYSVDVVSGALSLVAATANDTTLLSATNTAYPKALTSSWDKVAGTRYALGVLVVSGAAMPTLHGLLLTATNVVNTLSRLNPAIAGRVSSLSDLPSSVAAGSLVGAQGMPLFLVS